SDDTAAPWLMRNALEEFGNFRGPVVGSRIVIGAASLARYSGHLRSTKLSGGLSERVQHCLQLECRTADGLEHVGRRSLLLQRFAQRVEQRSVLDGDNRLVSEGGHQLDLLVSERLNALPCEIDGTNRLVLAQQRHGQQGPRLSKLVRLAQWIVRI